MEKLRLFWSWLINKDVCSVFGHIPVSTGKWRKNCPNVGLYKCSRCSKVTMTYPPLLDIAVRDKHWSSPEKYKDEVYCND